jgi:uncharacterized protein YjbI with pentapeptide repeats
MEARLRSWWQQIKKYQAVIISSILGVVIILIVAGYVFNWNWTGLSGYNNTIITTNFTSSQKITLTEEYQPGKTLWDWFQLLFIPAILTLGAAWFAARHNHDLEIAREQHANDIRIATDNQHEASLQSYIDKMSELLLEKQLRTSDPSDEVRNIAIARTLTALPNLDPRRKRSVLKFLQESGLIDKDSGVIKLAEADLSGADLAEANLSRIDLSGVNLADAGMQSAILSAANLARAELSKANLTRAHLVDADLNNAILDCTNMKEANLSGANLKEAYLNRVNLDGAILRGADLTDAYLFRAYLVGANLSRSNLIGTYLREAILSRTNLLGANLKGADLKGVDLREVDLTSADLSTADLSDAKITSEQLEQLEKTDSLNGATMPDGTIHP